MHMAILKAVCTLFFSKTLVFLSASLSCSRLPACACCSRFYIFVLLFLFLFHNFLNFFSPICVILRFFALFCAFLRFSRFLAFQNSNDCCLAHDVIWVSPKKTGQNFLETLLAAVLEGEVHLPLLSCLQHTGSLGRDGKWLQRFFKNGLLV